MNYVGARVAIEAKWPRGISAPASWAGGPRIPDQGWTLRPHATARPNTGSCPAQACWCEYREPSKLEESSSICYHFGGAKFTTLNELMRPASWFSQNGKGPFPRLPAVRQACFQGHAYASVTAGEARPCEQAFGYISAVHPVFSDKETNMLQKKHFIYKLGFQT